jgi:hypothetical protein
MKTNPNYLKRSQYQEIKWDDPQRPLTLQPWPIFINRELRRNLEEASTNVLSLIQNVPGRIFDYDPVKMSHYFDMPVAELKQLLQGADDEYMPGLIGRGDFVFSPSGLKCLEYNMSSSFAGWETALWEPMYLKNLIISKFIKQFRLNIINKNLIILYFRHFIEMALKFFPYDDHINIIIRIVKGSRNKFIVSMEQYLNSVYKDVLKFYSDSRLLKGKITFASIDELILKREHIYLDEKKIHLIIEYHKREVIPSEIMLLFKMKRILLYNGPIGLLMSNKLHLALLSENQDSDLFTAEERDIIKKHIPWTRKMVNGTTIYNGYSVQLEDFAISRRESLVIKPARGAGGVDVHIGYLTSQSQWKKLVSSAIADQRPWVVQELVESHPFLFQWGENGCTECNMVLGLLTFGSYYGGTWVRVLPRDNTEGVINAHQGAQETVALEVDE